MPVTVQPSVKEIHAFTSLSQLQEQVDKIPKSGLLSFRKLIESADKLYDNARLSCKEGDEETAYLYYMRAISLYHKSRSARDFDAKLDVKYWNSMCGCKFKTALTNSETLLNSLTRRYSLLEEIKNAKLKENAELEQLQHEQVEFGRDRSNSKTTCANATEDQPPNVPYSEMVEKTKRSIDCERLYKMLQKNEVLILDIRPEDEFEKSHIKNSQCLNIPPRILDVELTGYKIENSLHVGVRPTFRKRQTVNNIVLVDWECQLSDVERKGTRLRILYDALNEFDLNVPKNPSYVLDGGLRAFMFSYPTYVTNSNYKYEPQNDLASRKSLEKSINSVLYPDLPSFRRDITTQSSKSTIQPSVPDRKAKPNFEASSASTATAENDQSTATSNSEVDSTTLDDDINVKHGEMVSLLDSMSQKFDKYTKMYRREKPPANNDSNSEDLRHKYDQLKEDFDLKSRQYADLKRESDVQKLRAKKPDLQIDEKSPTVEKVQLELEKIKHKKDACLEEIQRLDVVEQEPSVTNRESIAIDEKSRDQSAGDSNVETSQDLPESNLKRARSSPNVAKLGQEKHLESIEDKIVLRPQIPDRCTKPRDVINIQAAVVQENEYYYKALRAITGPMAGVNPGTTGLRNLGNTCYMNSVIQCLSNTICLRQYFVVDGRYRNDINYSNKLGSRGAVARNFAVLLSSLWIGKFKYVSPMDFKQVVGSLAPAFESYDQQDAQEFLVFLLCALHEDLNKVYHKIAIPEESGDHLNFDVAAQKVWQNFLTNDQSLIIDNFYGQFASVMRCAYCGNISRNFEAFMSLTVPILENVKRCSLQECLQKFLSAERLSSDCSVYCSKCQAKRETYKRMMFWRLPSVLIIHFNRFKTVGRLGEKIKTFVDFPVTELNLSLVPGVDIPSAPYKLFGIINHYGSMESGHYTSFCRQRDSWYKFDDQEVSVVSQGSIKTDAAYLLFYAAF